MGDDTNEAKKPLQGKVIWIDLATPENDLLELIEEAGGTPTDEFDDKAYALVTSKAIGEGDSVERAVSLGIPVLTPHQACAQIRQELGVEAAPVSVDPTTHPTAPPEALADPAGSPLSTASQEMGAVAYARSRKVHDIGLAAIAVLAVVLAFAMAPSSMSAEDQNLVDPADQYTSLARLAETNRDLNAAQTESAPQQQVVNGWATLDYLAIVVAQNNDLISSAYRTVPVNEPPRDHRPAALLSLGIVALAWSRITYTAPHRSAST